jgi:hypothetical protein
MPCGISATMTTQSIQYLIHKQVETHVNRVFLLRDTFGNPEFFISVSLFSTTSQRELLSYSHHVNTIVGTPLASSAINGALPDIFLPRWKRRQYLRNYHSEPQP